MHHYVLIVGAEDGGIPPLSSTVTVYVNVDDVNDNAPVFDPSTYSDEVMEDAPRGTSILTVTATDIDSGRSRRVFKTSLPSYLGRYLWRIYSLCPSLTSSLPIYYYLPVIVDIIYIIVTSHLTESHRASQFMSLKPFSGRWIPNWCIVCTLPASLLSFSVADVI